MTRPRLNAARRLLRIVAACIVLSILAWPTANAAETNPSPTPVSAPIPDAEEVIQRCGLIFDELTKTDTSTAAMRSAALRVAECIRGEVLENMVLLTGEDHRAEMEELLEMVGTANGRWHWILYNEIQPCFRDESSSRPRPGCGTIYHPTHNAILIEIYGSMLRRVLRQRENYQW